MTGGNFLIVQVVDVTCGWINNRINGIGVISCLENRFQYAIFNGDVSDLETVGHRLSQVSRGMVADRAVGL